MPLQPLDLTIILSTLALILLTGLLSNRRKKLKRQSEFFVANRTLGSLLQFFLTFGYMADSNEAAIVATETYRQGAGGMWIGFQALFLTPFYWFTPVWFRRTRLITFPDLFLDRFNSRPLSAFYSCINILLLTVTLALGNLIAYKLAAALLVKPFEECTPAERASIAQFDEFQTLKSQTTPLAPQQLERYRQLDSLWARGEIASFVSYIRPAPFYAGYSLIIASYVLLGGIQAVAIVDGLQSILILIISLLLIPFALSRIHATGANLHQLVPSFMFRIFGSSESAGGGGGEYNWLSITAIVLNCLVGTPSTGGPGNASGKNEYAIRVGTLTGAFSKRLLMIAWMFCGLLGVALFGRGLSDPDAVWGALSSSLLPSGFMGLMIVGMLVGHMPMVGYTTITISALFTRNLYEPLRPARSQGHYISAAKLSILAALLGAALIALFFTAVISLLTTIMTFIAFAGATGYLIYFWRKLTPQAIWIGIIIWILLNGILPWALPELPSFRRNPNLLLTVSAESHPQQTGTIRAETGTPPAGDGQTAAGVGADLAPSKIAPAYRAYPLFFDKIARMNPTDPNSPAEGLGRFNMENYLVYSCGLPLQNFTPAQVNACRWFTDSALPFLLLILLSYLPSRPPTAEQEFRKQFFFAKLRTPIGLTPEQETESLSLAQANPHRLDHLKLFPNSNWEFNKWTRSDIVGFSFCWLVVIAILALLAFVLKA